MEASFFLVKNMKIYAFRELDFCPASVILRISDKKSPAMPKHRRRKNPPQPLDGSGKVLKDFKDLKETLL